VLSSELLTLDGHFDGLNFGFAATLGVEKKGLGGNGHGYGAVNLFEEVIHDCSRRLPGLIFA
jgi:hypothetical protein